MHVHSIRVSEFSLLRQEEIIYFLFKSICEVIHPFEGVYDLLNAGLGYQLLYFIGFWLKVGNLEKFMDFFALGIFIGFLVFLLGISLVEWWKLF